MGILQSLNDRGITIVLVTHEPDIAEHASRVLSFRDGRMIRDEKGVGRRAGAPPASQPHLVAVAGH